MHTSKWYIIICLVFMISPLQARNWLKQNTYPFRHLPPFKTVCMPNDPRTRPLFIFPGANDWCDGIDYFIDKVVENTNGKVVCIEYGKHLVSVFNTMDTLVRFACEKIEEEHLDLISNGFDLLGVSMGGLIARGVIQMCESGKYAKKLFTISAPHMGVNQIPSAKRYFFSPLTELVFRQIVYKPFLQKSVAATNFFKVMERYEEYKKNNMFLARINNEFELNEQYKERMGGLELVVCIGFTGDLYLSPPETVFFGFQDENNHKKVNTMRETRIYKEERLGLQKLDKEGKIIFLSLKGAHQNLAFVYGHDCRKFIHFLYSTTPFGPL